MAITLGHDISKYQGDVNFDTLKNNSQFVICKASEGVGYADPKLGRNKTEARRVGLLLGFYHFARPEIGNSPEKEADWFLQAIGDFREGELLALDFEVNWTGDVVNWCKKFLDRLSSRLDNYKPLIYMDQSRASSYNWKPLVDSGYGLWIAAYTYDPNKNNFQKGAWPFAAIQQWTSSQQVPGISGNTDGNVFFGDLLTLKKYAYKKTAVTPPPIPPTPPAPTPLINDQTLLNIGGEFGTIQLQAVRSELNDQKRKIEANTKTIKELENKIALLRQRANSLMEVF